MRSSILLASFLAVVPVRLISLALNPRIYITQFSHSLYLRLPPMLYLLGGMQPLNIPLLYPMVLTTSWVDATCKYMCSTSLSEAGP